MDLSFLGDFCFFINKSRKLEKSCGFYHCGCQSLDKGGESELRFLSKMHIHTYKNREQKKTNTNTRSGLKWAEKNTKVSISDF